GVDSSGWRGFIPDLALGFPCCVHFPCVHAAATTPVQQRVSSSLISPRRISLPRKGHRVGLHIVLFEACSAFTRVAACTLARSPIRDPLPEGFRHFVASMPAPVASGWSGCRVGLAPTGKRRLVTAHTLKRPSQLARELAQLKSGHTGVMLKSIIHLTGTNLSVFRG